VGHVARTGQKIKYVQVCGQNYDGKKGSAWKTQTEVESINLNMS